MLPQSGRRQTIDARKEMGDMTVAKVVEISSDSKISFEDAIQQGIKRATATLKNVRGAWVKEQKVRVEKGKIVLYRVSLQVTFELK
jgi:flavin-binding protein dodecin